MVPLPAIFSCPNALSPGDLYICTIKPNSPRITGRVGFMRGQLQTRYLAASTVGSRTSPLSHEFRSGVLGRHRQSAGKVARGSD
jgi:hypothetical protein